MATKNPQHLENDLRTLSDSKHSQAHLQVYKNTTCRLRLLEAPRLLFMDSHDSLWIFQSFKVSRDSS